MADASGFATRITLLGRLQTDPNDQEAWDEFVRQYGPKIHQWCRRWKLQEADAEDVTQIVLLKMTGKLRTFAYDPSRSFRAWLKTVTHHAWSDFIASRQRPGLGSGDSALWQQLDSLAAREDLIKHIEEEFDQQLLEEAISRVRRRVDPRTWEAFQLLAFERLSGAEAAARLQMRVGTVFVYKCKVQKLLQDEIRKLEETGAGG
jgi:RNA polymerase sigma-70 factor (ECF subfamily)